MCQNMVPGVATWALFQYKDNLSKYRIHVMQMRMFYNCSIYSQISYTGKYNFV